MSETQFWAAEKYSTYGRLCLTIEYHQRISFSPNPGHAVWVDNLWHRGGNKLSTQGTTVCFPIHRVVVYFTVHSAQ